MGTDGEGSSLRHLRRNSFISRSIKKKENRLITSNVIREENERDNRMAVRQNRNVNRYSP